MALDTWHTVAFCRKGDMLYGFIDGVMRKAKSAQFPGYSFLDADYWVIGSFENSSIHWEGWIDELYIKFGETRTSDYIVRDTPYDDLNVIHDYAIIEENVELHILAVRELFVKDEVVTDEEALIYFPILTINKDDDISVEENFVRVSDIIPFDADG